MQSEQRTKQKRASIDAFYADCELSLLTQSQHARILKNMRISRYLMGECHTEAPGECSHIDALVIIARAASAI